jgi:predicted DNA-binding transcriptional regulator YafY
MSQRGTIHRYTLIIEKLNGKQFPSAEELLSHLLDHGFEISKRTLERDFDAIRNEFGVEITYYRDKRGYGIDHDSSIDMPSFLRFLEIVNTAALLTESLSETKETLDFISFDSAGGLRGIDQLKPLLKAIKERRKISFQHYSFQTEKSRKYTCSPYLLKEYQNRWYLSGLVSGFDEMRTFGIDRMSDLQLSDTVFKRDEKRSPQQQFENIIGLVYSEKNKQKVILSFTRAQGMYVKSLPMHRSQKVLIDNEQECRIELNLMPNYELTQQILMHHSWVKVIEPLWLKEEIKSLLNKAINNYD